MHDFISDLYLKPRIRTKSPCKGFGGGKGTGRKVEAGGS